MTYILVCKNPDCKEVGQPFEGEYFTDGKVSQCTECGKLLYVYTVNGGATPKRKGWLKEWKHINTGRHSGDLVNKPNLEQ